MTATCEPSANRLPNSVPTSSQPSFWSASALFRDDAENHELQITLTETGRMSATLSGPGLEAFGRADAALFPISAYSATSSALIVLTGYDFQADRFHHIEAAVGATWSLDRTDGRTVEVAGTALITNLEDHTLTCYRAVRHHPFNNLDRAAVSGGMGPVVPDESTSGRQPGFDSCPTRKLGHRPWARASRRAS